MNQVKFITNEESIKILNFIEEWELSVLSGTILFSNLNVRMIWVHLMFLSYFNKFKF